MTSSSCSRACPAPGSPRSPSTRSTPRASVGTWSRCRRTPGSSWGRWRSPTSTSSRGSRRPSRSTRSPPAGTRAPRSAPSRRSTTTCACSSRAWVIRTAPTAVARSAARRPSRSSTRSWSCPRARSSRCWRPWSADARGSTRSCSATWRARGSRGPGSTARCASCPSRSACPRTTSTRSRSWSTAWSPSPTSGAAWPTPSRRRSSSRRGSRRSRCRRTTAGRRSRTSRRRSRARSAGCRSTSWRPGTSRSTRRTAPARRATGSARGSRSTRSWSSPTPTSSINEGAHRAVGEQHARVLVPRARGGGRGARVLARHAVEEAPEGRARRPALRLGRGGLRPVQEPVQPPALVPHHLRGRAPQHRAPPRRDRLGRGAREARAVHARDPVPDVQGLCASAPRAWPSRSAGSTSRSSPRRPSATRSRSSTAWTCPSAST